MKTNITILVITLMLLHLNLTAQDYSIKGKITSDIYAHFDYGGLLYTVDVSYGISKQFDMGLFYTSPFSKNNFVITGLDLRYYLTPFIFKKSQKFELYLKTNIAYLYYYDKNHDDKIKDYSYGGFIGLRYYPVKRIGIMTEIGYERERYINAYFGLTFKLKK